MFRKKIKTRMRALGNKKNISRKGGKSIQNYTPLIEAIQARDVNQVRRLLDLDNDPNEKDNLEGWSPMKWAHYVYLHGQDRDSEDNQRACLNIINLLIEKGVDIRNDYDNNESNTYIFHSAPPIEESENRNILSGGGNAFNEYTPLIKAIRERNVDRVEELLRNGADANQKDDREGWSPMKWNNYSYLHGPDHDNISNQALDDRITELLLRYGANMMGFDNMDTFKYDFSRFGQNQNQSGDYTQRNTGGKRRRRRGKTRKIKTRIGGSSTVQDRIRYALHREYTPLINAIIDNDPEEVEQLLNNGSDPNETDTTYQWTPLKWAVFVYAFGVSDVGEAMYYERQSIETIIGLLENAGALNIPNEPIQLDRYNFEPVVFNGEIEFQQDNDDDNDDNDDNDDDNDNEIEYENNNNSRNTSGGKRRRNTRKSKKSHKKTKKAKKSTTKRRKH
jgi:hypothetical protein